ncbi:MAG: hypothetical protein ACYC3X_27760, partial [Pirellulaceae bacterium]
QPDRTRAALPQSPRAVPAASRALIAAPRQGRQQDFARLPKAHLRLTKRYSVRWFALLTQQWRGGERGNE